MTEEDANKPKTITTVVLVVILLAGFASKINVDINLPYNNDHVVPALYYYDMAETRNFLMKNWYIPVNNYLYTDYPIYFFTGSVLGMDMTSIHIGAFIVFAAISISLCLLIRSVFGPTAALAGLAALWATPVFPSRFLFMPHFHTGTIMCMLLACLLLDALMRRQGSARQFFLLLAALSAHSALSVFSDMLFVFIFIIPAVLALVLIRSRTGEDFMPYRKAFAVSTSLLAALAFGIALSKAAKLTGLNFAYAAPNTMIKLNIQSILNSLSEFLASLGKLFDMGIPLSGGNTAWTIVAKVLNLGLFIAAVFAAVRAIRREQEARKRIIMAMLAISSALLCAAYVFKQFSTAYYLLPLVVSYAFFLSPLLAGRLGAGRKIAAALVILFALSSSYSIRQGIAYSPTQGNADLAAFLESEGLAYGYSSYWNSNITTVLSKNRVKVRPVRFDFHTFEPYMFFVKSDWFSHRHYTGPTFLIVRDGEKDNGFGILNESTVAGIFGRPRRTIRFGDAAIYVWDYNIIQKYWINAALRPQKSTP